MVLKSLIKEKATFDDPIFSKRAEQLGLEDFLYLTQFFNKGYESTHLTETFGNRLKLCNVSC